MTGDDRTELFDEPLIRRLADDRRRRDRDWLTGLIQDHLNEPDCRIVLLTGPPGAGKSTVMAHLAQRHRDWPRYFIRRAGESDSDTHWHEGGVTSFLTQVGFQLLHLRGDELFPAPDPQLVAELVVDKIDPTGDAAVIRVAQWFANPFRPHAVRALLKAGTVKGRATVVEIGRLVTDAGMAPKDLEEAALRDPLRRLAKQHRGEQIVVLIDGLDEVRFRDGVTDVGLWLSSHEQFPANLRIVVASRPDSPLLSVVRGTHEDSVREVLIDDDEHLPEVTRDVHGYLRDLADEPEIAAVLSSHGVSPDRFAREVLPKAGGNFLYLEMIARLLDAEAAARRGGLAPVAPVPDLDWLDSIETLPKELPAFYALLLLRVHIRVGGWDGLYRPLLGVLAVTMFPLASGQLREFGGIGHDQATVEGALGRLSFLLDGDQQAGFRLHHAAMADFLTDNRTAQSEPVLYCDPAAWHGRITDYAVRLHGAAGTWRHAEPYLRRRLPLHAAQAGRLDDLVEDPRYLLAADPDALVPELSALGRARPIELVYQQVVPLLRDGDTGGALAHLKLYAEQAGLAGFAARVPAGDSGAPFLLGFTNWEDVRLRQVLGRHDGEVTGVAITQGLDRRPLAVTGGDDGRIRVWDLLAGREADGRPLSAERWVTALAAGELDSGDPIAVTGDFRGAVRVWDLASRRPIGGPLIGPENSGYAVAVAFAGSGPRVVCRIMDEYRAWDLATLKPAHPLFQPEGVLKEGPMAAAAWGGTLVLATVVEGDGDAGRVRVWDTATGAPFGPAIETRCDWITAIALAEIDGTFLVAIADGDHAIQVFDASTGQPWSRRVLNADWDTDALLPLVTALAIGPVGGRPVLAAAEESGQVRFRELPSLRPLGGPVQAHDGEVTALAFGPAASGGWLATAGKDAVGADGKRPTSARFWVPEVPPVPDGPGHRARPRKRDRSGPRQPDCRLTPAAPPISLSEPAKSIALGGAGGPVEALIVDGRRAVRWDAGNGTRVGTPLGGRNERVHAVGVATVAGRTVAVSATYDKGAIRTWEIPACEPALHPVTGQPLIRRDIEDVRGLAVTRLHDKALAVCAGWGEIRVWDVATGDPAGAGLITGLTNILSLAVGELAGRPIVACRAGSPNGDGVMVFDLETGARVDPQRAGRLGPLLGYRFAGEAVAIAGQAQRTLVVSGSTMTIGTWDPASPDDPTVIEVAGEASKLAATYLRGRPVAVCSGRKGEVRLIDLTPASPDQRPAVRKIGRTDSLAIARAGGRPVAVCATREDGIRVLDLVTGQEAASPPGTRLRSVYAVATGTLHGRPVAVAGGHSSHAWYLDTGEPLAAQPDWPEAIHSVAIADAAGRVIAVAGTWNNGVIVVDLETGHRVGDPVTSIPGNTFVGVGVVTVSGRPVLVGGTRDCIRARYLDLPWLPPHEPDMSYSEFTTRDEAPPPPALFPARRLSRDANDTNWSMALGPFDGQPVVISGHDGGTVDVVEVASGLPLATLGGGKSAVTAVAYQRLGGRQVMAAGTADGTVRIVDLADLSAQTSIKTLALVRTIALAEPDHCLIGTEKGLVAIRLPVLLGAGQDDGTRGRLRLPVDIRARRACPEHDGHRHLVRKDGHLAERLCLKGVQRGGVRKADSLSYPAGHCYVLPGRLEIEAAGAAEGKPAPPLSIDLTRAYAEPVDDWAAYQTNGCHFGIGVDSVVGGYLTLSCYRRGERDWLLAQMRKR